MKQSKIPIEKRIKSMLNELWNVYELNPINYNDRFKILGKYRLSGTVDTAMKAVGILIPFSKGYATLANRPKEYDSQLVHKKVIELQRAYYAELKQRLSKEPSQPDGKLHQISEDVCTSILKRNGYKILKPTTTYEEI